MTAAKTVARPKPKPTPAHAPRFIPAVDNPDETYDDWEASSATVDLLVKVLSVYNKNEGHWHRARIQRDLWRAVKAIQPHLLTARR